MNKIGIDIENKVGPHNINDFLIKPTYHGECPNCKEYTEFECIDVNMADIIRILNSKGYYTAYSCEGHIEPDAFTGKDTFSIPYIYFYFWDDSEVLKEHQLPNTWTLSNDDIKAEMFSISDNILDMIPEEIKSDDSDKFISWLYDNWDKESRLEDIYNWAVSLPDRDKEFKESRLELSKTHGNMMLIENSERYMKIHGISLIQE
jgi:hypothetical protein